MTAKGWLRKRPLRESSPNLLPLQHSTKPAYRSSAATASNGSSKCFDPSNGKSATKHSYERENPLPSRMSKSLSLSSLVGMSLQTNTGEVCTSVNKSNSCECQKPSPTKSSHSNKIRHLHLFYQTKIAPFLHRLHPLLIQLYTTITRIKPTPKQISFLLLLQIIIYTHYRISHQSQWEQELDWITWENQMQDSLRQSIPPRLNLTASRKFSILDHLKLFPNLQLRNVSEYVVPLPDYDEMAYVREQLASNLHSHATQTHNTTTHHLLPVIGITVANDTPQNRYLRRILHTIDFDVVGSIVITWYDEHTESQLLNNKPGLSHEVIKEGLEEFITRFGFVEVDWTQNDLHNENSTASTTMASFESLQLMSKTTTSIYQYCLFSSEQSCRNELLILRFPTNLGCATGVNNALFTHPTARHWLVANYDIAYPTGILRNMGEAVGDVLGRMPELAVLTFGFIYGRGHPQNPWSNFLLTSHAISQVGTWDENIYPAYYEDDDYRDRIRYILGRWHDVFGNTAEGYEDTPMKWMDDGHLIRYLTDRSVAVAHGPLEARGYISGMHDTMSKVEEEELENNHNRGFWSRFFHREDSTESYENPFHYESLRWKTVRELADTERFFRCKHGNLPDPGEFGEDTLRYFGWNERFVLPFVNETRVDRLRRRLETNDTIETEVDLSSWARWSFNATRRKCVHEGANHLLSLPYSEDLSVLEERKNLTLELRRLCSVC